MESNICWDTIKFKDYSMDIMRECFTVSLAGLIIELDTISTSACVFCREYLQDGTPDIKIKVTREDIDREYSRGIVFHNKVSAETTAVHRKIVEAVLEYNIFLMHGAVISIGDNAYMFSAPSGIGKTTHIKLWLNNVKNAIVVNGDKPFIKISQNKIMACGSPWCGKEDMSTNIVRPLKSIVILERAEYNHIEEIGFAEAYPNILRQTYIPKDPQQARKTLSLLSSIYGKVRIFRFQCNNYKDDCFEVAYNALVGKGTNRD